MQSRPGAAGARLLEGRTSMLRHPANLAAAFSAAFVALLVLLSPARARPVQSPPPPPIRPLEPASAGFARLTWDDVPDASFRLCVTWDRERHQPYACFPAGSDTSALVGIPPDDNQQFLLSLQSCLLDDNECSQP